MIRKISMLGLAICALVALSGAGAASASAETFFHSEVEKTFGIGEQIGNTVYDTAAGSIQCKKVAGTGVINSKTATAVTITPIISECTAFGLAAEFNMNGCQYTATSSGIVHLECPAGREVLITIKAAGCTIGTPAQTGSAIYTNKGTGSARDVEVTSTSTNLVYTVTGGFGACGTPGVHNDGKTTGALTVRGYSDEAHTKQVGVWVE